MIYQSERDDARIGSEQEEGSGEESPADRLKEIIQEVNTEVLNRTEILSDSLYYYSVEEDRFEIVQ